MKRLIMILFLVLLAVIWTGCALSEEVGAGKEHPCIHIVTEEGQPVLSRETYVPATITVFNCDEAYELTAECGIRVRGNSTAEQGEEKPYRIRFEKKQNMLGLHNGLKYRNWVLLRTYWHLCPDYMGFRLAETIFEGKYYSSDCMFVNLYLNGKDLGIYLLCEQNQAARDRMDVYEPEEGETRTEIGYLLEMDNYPDDEHPGFGIGEKPYVEDIAGRKRVVKGTYYAIKSDVQDEKQEKKKKKWLKGVYSVIDFSADSRYKKLTFLGPWDLSWGYIEPPDGGFYAGTFQNHIQGMDNSNPWFVLAMKLEGFRSIVRERWKALSGSGVLTETTRQVLADIEDLAGDLGEENAGKLTEGKKIVDYVNARIRWLDGQWSAEE